jgi:hypothetical protein
MNVEDQLRAYQATLDTATEEAAAANHGRVAPPIRIRPARTFVVAAVAVAAASAIAVAAMGVSHRSSAPPASGGTSTTAPTTIAPPSRTVVPDVVGMNAARAASTLGQLGFVTVRNVVTNCVADGLVVEMRPEPGTKVVAASAVTIGVCAQVPRPASTTLPVVGCAPTYGVPPTTADPKAPTSVTISTPPFDQPRLSGYSDLRGFLPLVAPAGWTCKALEATDGGQAVGVTPPGVSPRDSWGVGSKPTLPLADGVYGSRVPACQGCVYDEICGIVPSAEADFPGFVGLCNAPPAGQRVTPLGHNRYAISDPPGALGRDAAHSVLKYTPRTATTDATVERITCILPASQQNVCTALIDAFFELHP